MAVFVEQQYANKFICEVAASMMQYRHAAVILRSEIDHVCTVPCNKRSLYQLENPLWLPRVERVKAFSGKGLAPCSVSLGAWRIQSGS